MTTPPNNSLLDSDQVLLLNQALHQVSDAVFLIDGALRFLFVNETACRNLGYSREELLAMSPSDIIPDVTADMMSGLVATGSPSFEGCYCSKDGRIFPIEINASPFEWRGKACSLCIARDLTEHKRLQEALTAREREYRLLTDDFPENLLRYDTDCRCIYANPRIEMTLGIPAKSIVGKTPMELFPAGQYREYQGRIEKVLQTGSDDEMEVVLSDPTGRNRYHHIFFTPERDREGTVIGALVVGRDITASRWMEEVTQARFRMLEVAQVADLSLPETLSRMLDEMEKQTASRIGFYHFLEEDQQTISLQSWSNNTLLAMCTTDSQGRHYPLQQAGVWADCVRQRRPVIHNNYPALGNRRGMPEGHVPVIREMVVPVFRGGRIVAIVGVGNKSVAYTDTDVQILSLLGDFSWEIVIRKRVEEELATREREFRMVVENSPDCIVRFDTEGRFAYVNPRWEQIMAISADTVLGRPLPEVMVSEEAARYAQKLRKVIETGRDDEIDILFPHADKRERHHNIRLVAERGAAGEITGVLAMGRDITEIKSYQERLQNLAFFDPLTRLPNRENFNLRLEQILAETKRAEKNTVVGVMFLDLDDFKTVNDILGHEMGDRLLCKVGERLCDSVRNYDLVARLGGDEFALILPDFRQGIDLSVVARKILAAIKDPFYIDGKELFISASIGIACCPIDSGESSELLRFADAAMYHAKKAGYNGFRFYSESMTRQATDRLELEADLRKALQLGQFELYFQPKVNTLVGLVVGSEALLRWRHPARGLVTPDQFIGIAEDTGLIVEIGAWVLEQACRAAVAWNQAAPFPLKVAVNLSVRQFLVGDIVQTVQAVLSRTGCRPDWLELEITESLLMANRATIISSLETLTKLGINIGIDDFGTGYSSLSYLTRFPVSTLKIDRLFIQEMTSEKRNLELVKAIVSMGLALGLELVAEGVEDAEQAACLDKFGCHIVQGYFYGRPMPLERFNDWWSEFYQHRSWEKESQGESTPLLWRDYLTTGHELIDAQHRELFRRIAQLSALCRDQTEAEEILQLLDFLSDYVGSHFAVEEELLRSLNSPRFQAHKAEHAYFANVVDRLVSLYREGGATASLVLETHCVAVNWLTRHICSMDRELADSLLNPG